VGNQITPPNLPLEIYKLPKLPHFCHLVEWAIQLPYPICHSKYPNCPNYPISVTRLSGRSNYPTWFATWNPQFAKITPFLSPGWVGSPITWPDSSHPVEWVIQFPHPICHLKSPNCQNYLISLTRLSGQSNYPTQFATWNLQIAKITPFLSPGWVGNLITLPNLPSEISKLPKLPNFCHPVEWAIQLPNPIFHLKYPNSQNHHIFVTQLSGQSNYTTQFAICKVQIAKTTWFLSPSWVGDPLTPPDLPLEIHKLPKLPHFCHPLEWAIQLPYPISHLKSPNCQITSSLLPSLRRRSDYPSRFTNWHTLP